MILPIVIYGDPVLKTPAKPIEKITAEIKDLAKSMIETMHNADGVGLAAQQIGKVENICVIDVPPDAEYDEYAGRNDHVGMPLVIINPEIQETSGTMRRNEGCLSFPEVSVGITRPHTVKFSYTDLDGKRITTTVYGLLARAVLHETDHLRGVLMSDKMSPAQRLANGSKLRRLQRGEY